MSSFTSDYASAHRAFMSEGYFVEPALWSTGEVSALVNRSHQWENFRNKNYQSVMNPHLTDELFLKAVSNPKIITVLKSLFEGPVSAVQSQLFYGPPGCSGYSLHQDNFFLQTDPRYFISVWSSFEDTSEENGGLIVFPKSQVEPILNVKEVPPERRGNGQDPNSDKVECDINPEKYQQVSLSTFAGDSVFIHANLLHASHKNRTPDRFRHVLLSTYIRTGVPFRAGTYAKRKEIPLG